MARIQGITSWVKASVKPALAVAAGLAFVGLSATSPAADPPAKSDSGATIDFAKDIQPILKDSCIRCHKAPDPNAARGPGGPGGPQGGPGGGGPGGPGGGGPGGPGGGGPGGPGGPGGGGPGGLGGRGRGPQGPSGGLNLENEAAALKGGRHGAAIVPGKADDSLLYKVLKGDVQLGNAKVDAMPRPAQRGQAFKPLPDEKIELIKKWIDQGAKWSTAPAKAN